MALTIKQGDQYDLEIEVAVNDQPITKDTLYSVETVEIYLGDNMAEYKANGSGEVRFANGVFLFPLSQKMTFALRQAPVRLDIRVKTTDGQVHGMQEPLWATVKDAVSRREL